MMANYEKKIAKALFDIEGTVKKLDGTLEKLDKADNKAKHFIEQEKAIHEIKKIAREYDKIEKFEEKEELQHENRIKADIYGQEKALKNIVHAVDKLDEELSKISDDDGKVKSFIAQKKITHQVKKILHNVGLYEMFVEDEVNNLI